MPSVRVTAREFLSVLAREGIATEVLGEGTAEAEGPSGRMWRVPGVLVAEVRVRDVHRIQARAGLCGVGAVLLDQARSSRANVVS